MYENFRTLNFCVKIFCILTPLQNSLYSKIFLTKKGVSTCEFDLFDYRNNNINISLSKREVGCHTKRTNTMAEVYLNDAVVFEHTFQLPLAHLSYTYVQTKESADCILIIYNAVSSLIIPVVSTKLTFYAVVVLLEHNCSLPHSQLLCLQEL